MERHILPGLTRLSWTALGINDYIKDITKAESSGLTPRSSSATEELLMLRKELIALFNDRFTEELLDTAKNQPPAHRGFLEVLVKDIKSMIQFSPA